MQSIHKLRYVRMKEQAAQEPCLPLHITRPCSDSGTCLVDHLDEVKCTNGEHLLCTQKEKVSEYISVQKAGNCVADTQPVQTSRL